MAALIDIAIEQKRYPDRQTSSGTLALQDLRFSLAAGEFVCLVGPSGCGKSTLLHIINGLDTDYVGSISGSGVSGETIATMFQTPRLMPWLSVLDNVRLVLADRATAAAATATAREWLDTMGLSGVIDAYPKTLSGGMQRRVALARAFAIKPRLLLMDEPFISLDAPVANRLRARLIELWQRLQTTVLFVTHDLREALALADRVLFMSASPGRIVLNLPIALSRPRGPDDPAVAELQQRLLGQHPALLAGLSSQSTRELHLTL